MIKKIYITKSQKCMYLVKNEAFCGHLLLLFTNSHSSGHTIETLHGGKTSKKFFSVDVKTTVYT